MDRGPTGTGSPPTSFAGSVGVVGAVEVQGDAACSRVVPIGCGRLCAGRCVPLQFAGFDASEEPAPAEDRMVASQLDQSSGERRKLLVSRGPVEPADLVVLAVCVVVPSLRAAEFVAAENHRDSEGEQQGGQHGAPLPRTQVHHGGIGGRPLDAAVPGAVVVGAVTVRLAIGFVVLDVVRDQVGQGEPVVDGDQVDRRRGPASGIRVEVRRAGQP